MTLLAMAFVVDVANLSRLGGDLLEPLVFAAVAQANQAALRADPELDRRYAASGETLPDELRRPISIHAVAQSLELPFETVRRRVLSLAEAGFLVASPAGVYAPAAAIASPRHAAIQAARLARLSRLHDDLVAVGFLGPEEVSPLGLPPELARSVNRILSQYMLRACQRMIEIAGGVSEGFALLGLICANAEPLLDDLAAPPGAWAAHARPCTGVALARRLQLPRETARRHLLTLRQSGLAQGRGRAWFACVPPGEAARLAGHAAENEADLHRLFARLSELPPS